MAGDASPVARGQGGRESSSVEEVDQPLGEIGDRNSSSVPARLRSEPRWFLVGLLAVAALAGAIRFVNVLVLRPTCIEDIAAVAVSRGEGSTKGFEFNQGSPGCFGVAGDAAYGYLQGRLLADGNGFIDGAAWFGSGGTRYLESAGDPPVYATVLAALSKLGLTSATSQRLASSVVGVIGVVLIAVVVRRLAGRRAALIGGVLAATYPLLWINDGMLLSESMFVTLIALVLLCAYRFWDRPGFDNAVILGASVALAALTRAEALLLFGVLLVPLLWGIHELTRPRRVALLVTAWGAGALLILPWFAYNMTRFENPVLMTSGTGAVLSAANCDTTYYGDYIGYYANCFDEYVAAGQARWPDPSVFDESQRDRVSQDAALAYIKSHKGDQPRVMATRVLRMFDFYNPELGHESELLGQNVRVNWAVEGRGKRPSQIGFLEYFALLPFAVWGLVVFWRNRVPISPLLAMPVIITATAAFTFGITRYRVPVDVILVITAGAGMDAIMDRWRRAPDGDTLSHHRGRNDPSVRSELPLQP